MEETTGNPEYKLPDEVIITLLNYLTNGTVEDRIQWGRKYGALYTTYGTKIPLWDEENNFFLRVNETPSSVDEKPTVQALVGDYITITDTILLDLLYKAILQSLEREKVAAAKAEVERLTRLAKYIEKIPD